VKIAALGAKVGRLTKSDYGSAMIDEATHAYRLVRPEAADSLLVFASPHSGQVVPTDMNPARALTEASLHSACDIGMDRLVARASRGQVPLLTGQVSRAYVDLNRATSELDPYLICDSPENGLAGPKTRAGYGVVPRLSGDGQPLYDRFLSMQEVQARLDEVHAPYHQALAGLMTSVRQQQGRAVLIDWHSMPHRATGPGGPDVVLGDRFGTACDIERVRHLTRLFQDMGWRVSLNRPYAGGFATQVWGRPDDGFEALQIELSRRLYWDETQGRPSDGWRRCQNGIARVVAALLETCGT